MTGSLFRKEALAEVSSPEKLNHTLQVTSPLGWLALLTVLAVIGGMIAWAVFGTYRGTVSGIGMLVRTDGAFVSVYAPKAGWIESYVNHGRTVNEGELLARLSSPEEAARVSDATRRVTQLRAQREALAARLDDRLARARAAAERRRAAVEQTIDLGRAQIGELESLVEAHEGLQAKGLMPTEPVIEARARLAAARQQVARAEADLVEIDLSLLAVEIQNGQELDQVDRQIDDGEAELGRHQLSESLATAVYSRVDGEVTLNDAGTFALVAAGQKLMVIETGKPRLEALLYVPVASGKAVAPGMQVRLSPTTAAKEEYGVLVGTVQAVGNVPESETTLAERLGNLDLARLFMRSGPPIQVVVTLDEGPAGPESYAWTSQRGGEVSLSSGIVLDGQVTVDTGRPIVLVIPALRRWLGL